VSCISCETLHQASAALDFNPVCSPCTEDRPILDLLAMEGCYPLTGEAIDDLLDRTSAGNYALGFMDGVTFVVSYVGRSDSDVRARLHEWVDAPSQYRRYAPGGCAAWGGRRSGATPLEKPALRPVGNTADTGYTHFAYRYATSPAAAFDVECRNYEDFGGSRELDNEAPPTHEVI
jgi:hypothetical protein